MHHNNGSSGIFATKEGGRYQLYSKGGIPVCIVLKGMHHIKIAGCMDPVPKIPVITESSRSGRQQNVGRSTGLVRIGADSQLRIGIYRYIFIRCMNTVICTYGCKLNIEILYRRCCI